jgi:prophage regulatory protein
MQTQEKKQLTVLRMPDVVARSGLKRSSIYELMACQQFPASFPLTASGRAVGWSSDEVEAWVRDRIEKRGISK